MIGRRVLPLLLAIGILCGSVTLPAADPAAKTPEKPEADKSSVEKAPSARDQEYYELMEVFADTFEQIERNYVKEVDRRKLMEAALKGMLLNLEDPYSNYISPDEIAQFKQVIEQEFQGIGIHVTVDPQNRRLTVMSPLPGSPAHKAGIRAGDIIMDIEGKSTEGMSLEDAVKLMKGPPGTTVKVGVLHTGEKKAEQLTVGRAMVQLASVMGDAYNPDGTWNFLLNPEKKIGYIRLISFSRNTSTELRAALNKLESEGMKALILDLRNNPGGLLPQAIEVADLFLEEGTIVSTKGRNTEERKFDARKKGTIPNVPMAILVNRYSASASEIVSAALQDHKRGIVIGERSWGKGSVQNVIDLEAGKSQLKLTTASYHRPSGKNIHRFPNATEKDEWGVMPDDGYSIRFTNEEFQKFMDARRQRDVLSKEGPPKSDFADTQLNKAVDYVLAQIAKPEEKKDEKKEDKAAATKGEQKEEKKAEKKAEKTQSSRTSRRAPLALLFRNEGGVPRTGRAL